MSYMSTKASSAKSILICPLNWGMGHATRCIPIARKLQQMGHNIDFASDGPPRELLKLEFPEVRHHLLPSYKITYPTKSIILNVGRKLGSFFLAIKNEHKKVKELVTEYKYDVIISDNRFGCYSPQTKNIFGWASLTMATA